MRSRHRHPGSPPATGRPGRVHPALLLFAVFGGHGAWTVQLFALAVVVALGCPPDAAGFQVLDRPWVEGAFVVVSLGAVLVGLAAIATALHLLGRARRSEWHSDERSRERARFVAVIGTLINGVTLSVILATAMSPGWLTC